MIKGGPKIVNDGLVLCLDAHDAKSYAGEPVTNLYGDISTSTALRPNRTEYNTSGTWTTDMPMCPENVGRVYKHTSGALTSSWSGNSYGYMLKDIATTSGETYIVTCWVYVSSDCNISGCPVVIEQEASGESTVSGYDGGYDLNNKGTWQLLAKKCVADDQVRFIPLYPSRNGVTDGSFSGFFAWGGAQVVKASYVTPYVLSSRSATNGWLDRTGNSTGGTLTNMTGTEVSHYRDGQVIMPVANSYLEFDGSDAEVIISQNSAINLSANSPYTLEYWVRFDYLPTTTFVATVMKGSFSTSYGHLFIKNTSDANTTIYVYTDDDSSPELSISRLISTSTWYHIAQTFSSGTAKIYINGELEASTSGLTSTSNTSALRLGSHAGANYFLNGDLAKVNIYNIALTDAQVLQNYNATKERF